MSKMECNRQQNHVLSSLGPRSSENTGTLSTELSSSYELVCGDSFMRLLAHVQTLPTVHKQILKILQVQLQDTYFFFFFFSFVLSILSLTQREWHGKALSPPLSSTKLLPDL